MADSYSATAIIRNEMEWNAKKGEWKPFPDTLRKDAFDALKEFVAGTARGNRRRRIMETATYNVSDWGILRRLMWYPSTGKVDYCCGQEWYSEMAVLRDAFDWKK